MAAETTKMAGTEFTNSNIETMYSADEITARIAEMGAKITAEYAGKDLVLVGVLKGSCVFLADLMRHVDLPLTIDFMSVSSYKDGTTSTGDIEILKDLSNSIRDKHVLIVEDIIDTGLTLSRLVEILGSRGAASIKIATFLDKPEPRIKKELVVDHVGFVIPNKFVVGYGLDAAGRYRNLPFVGVVIDPSAA